MRQLQDARLPKSSSKDLHTHWELSVDLATRYRDPRNSCQRSCNCIYISKIHLEWIVRALPQFERRNRRSRRQDRIHLGKRIAEVLRYQGTNLLPLQIVSVVISRRKHISPQHDAALYLCAKSCPARLPVHGEQGIVIHAQTVTHTVVSLQVGTRFRRRDDVVSSDA